MIEALRRAWRAFRAGEDVSLPLLPVESDGPLIADGLAYWQPPVVPGDVLAAGSGAVRQYLSEAASDYRAPFDKPYRNSAMLPVSIPADDPLAEWDYATRRQVLINTHAAYHRNPIARRAVDITRQFAIGKGHTVNAHNKALGKLLEEFRKNDENNVYGYDRTFLQDLEIDGELFVRFYEADGEVVIAPIPPWHVRTIVTEPGFFRRVRTYELEYPGPGGEIVREGVPADQILHVAINAHSYELRGRPSLFVILPWLKAYHDWLEDRARQNKWRGSLVWWVKIAGATAQTLAHKVLQYRRPPTPGSVVVTGDREEWQALHNPVGANDVSEDGRQIRMMNAVGMGLAEFQLGDGENANLATATAQQLPALWKFTDAQELMKEQVWTPIYQRVIEAAIRAGRIGAEVRVEDANGSPSLAPDGQEMYEQANEAFVVEYYELQADDPKTLAEAMAIATSNEWASNETAAGRLGFDYRAEMKRILAERQAMRDQATQGLALRPQDIGVPDEDVEGQERGEPTAAPAAA